MRVVRHASSVSADLKGGCIALGNFDGVHLGHQNVIGTARAIAHENRVPLGVMTFEPHPRRFFHPDQAPFALTTFRLKARLIEAQQAAFLIVQTFDETLACGSADWFVHHVLKEQLAVSHVVVGQDYAFGQGRQGTVATLQALGRTLSFGVSAVSPVFDASGRVISSTRIRTALEAGDVEQANALLGHPWEIDGRVEHGDARGRLIGFPTANLKMGDMLAPAMGVYAVTVGLDTDTDTCWHRGVANFGRRPTFGINEPVLEVHIFDFDGDLYGQHLRVRFHHFLRPEQSFPGLEALKTQIAADSASARRLLASGPAASGSGAAVHGPPAGGFSTGAGGLSE